jgi:hypothetical protein
MARPLVLASIAGVLMLPLFLPLAVAAADRPLIGGDAPYLLQEPRGLLWGGRDFTTRGAFESFLTSRGADYDTWAKRHPGASALAMGPRRRDVLAAWGAGTMLMVIGLFGIGARSSGAREAPGGRQRRALLAAAAVAVATGLTLALWRVLH